MAARTTRFEMQGLQQFGANLRALGGKAAVKVCGQATGAAARIVREAAKNNIRSSPAVDTGSLLESIIVKKLGSPPEGLTAAHIVTPRRRKSGSKKTRAKQQTAPHAGYVEFGTVNMPAEPYLGPAVANNIGPATNAMKQAAERGIKRETARLKK